MPGKVNPVMAESLLQVCVQVIGNDAAVTLGGLSGNFELNVMMPMMTHNLLQSIELLSNAVVGLHHPLPAGAGGRPRTLRGGWSSRGWRCARPWRR